MDSTVPQILDTTITYFENNQARMKYAAYQKQGYPIGSGVTEAACKVVAKQRLNQSGMRWNIYPIQQMLLHRGWHVLLAGGGSFGAMWIKMAYESTSNWSRTLIDVNSVGLKNPI